MKFLILQDTMPIHVQLVHIILQCMVHRNPTACLACPDIIVTRLVIQGSPNQQENALPDTIVHQMSHLEVQLQISVRSIINVLRARRIQSHVHLDIIKRIRAQRTVSFVRQVRIVHAQVHLMK